MIFKRTLVKICFFFYLIFCINCTPTIRDTNASIYINSFSDHILEEVFDKSNNITIWISNTSKVNPFVFDLSQYSNHLQNYSILSFRSTEQIQFILFKNPQLFKNLNFSFSSVSVTFSTNNISFDYLTLANSPLVSTSEKLNLTIGSLKTDYVSIPDESISQIFLIDFLTLIENSEQPPNHAKLIFSSTCRQFIETNINQSLKQHNFFNKPHLNPKTLDNSYYTDNATRILISENNITLLHNADIIDTLFYNESGEIIIYIASHRFSITNSNSNIINGKAKIEFHLLSEVVVIFDNSWLSVSDTVLENVNFYHDENVRVTFTTNLNEVPYITVSPTTNVRYIPNRPNRESYCLCLQTRFETCVSNQECQIYSVPLANYYSSSNDSFPQIIADSKASTINFYLTYSSQTDFHTFSIRSPSRNPQTLNFFSVLKDLGVKLHLSESNNNLRNSVTINCVDIKILLVSFDRVSIVDTLQLKTSTLLLTKSMYINNFISDSDSLIEQQNEELHVFKTLTINKTQLSPLGVNIILRDKAKLEIQDISLMPSITIRQQRIAFSFEDNEMSFQYSGSVVVDIFDQSRGFPLIYFRTEINPSDADVDIVVNFNLIHSLAINFESSTPSPNGVQVNFIPNEDEMTSLELILPLFNNFDSTFRLFPFTSISGNIALILTSPRTVLSVIGAAQRGYFETMNVIQLELNVYDSLKYINLNTSGITATIELDDSNSYIIGFKGVIITQQLTLITNTTDVIEVLFNATESTELFNNEFPSTQNIQLLDSSNKNIQLLDVDDLNETESEDKNSTFFKLKTTGSSTILHFDESFEPVINHRGISTIQVQHDKNDLAFMTELSVIPMVYVEDDVSGVLFYANKTEFNVSASSFLHIQQILSQPNNGNFIFDNDKIENYRSGPNISVSIDSPNIYLLQSEFLAECVKFTGEPFYFITKSKSRALYIFDNLKSLTIVPYELLIDTINHSRKELNSVNQLSINEDYPILNLNEAVLLNANANSEFQQLPNKEEILQQTNKLLTEIKFDDFGQPLNLNLINPIFHPYQTSNLTSFIESLKDNMISFSDDYLLAEMGIELSSYNYSFHAISMKLTNSPFRFAKNLIFHNETNSIEIVNKRNSNEMLFLFNYLESDVKSLLSIQSSIVSGLSVIDDDNLINVTIIGNKISCYSLMFRKIAHLNQYLSSAYFVVHYHLNQRFDVSIKSKEIESKFIFVLSPQKVTYIHLDESWYDVRNADNVFFVVMNASSIIIETELRSMPNVRVVNSDFQPLNYYARLYHPAFTIQIGFIIFVSLACAVIIICASFLLISCWCPSTVSTINDKYFIDLDETPSVSSIDENLKSLKHKHIPILFHKSKNKKNKEKYINDKVSFIEMSSDPEIITQSVSGYIKDQYSDNDRTQMNSLIIDDELKNFEGNGNHNKLDQYSDENELASGENEQSSDYDDIYKINQH